jgi:hypothetical protein
MSKFKNAAGAEKCLEPSRSDPISWTSSGSHFAHGLPTDIFSHGTVKSGSINMVDLA